MTKPKAVATNTSERDFRAEVVAIYEKYNPEKMSSVEKLLTSYAGKEEALIKKLTDKYITVAAGAPADETKTAGSTMKAPGSGMKAPGSGMKAPGSGMKAPGSGMKAPGGLKKPGLKPPGK